MEDSLKHRVEELLRNHQAEQACELCRQSMATDKLGDDAGFLFLYGKSLWQSGKQPQAEAFFRRAVELDPEGPAKVALEMCEDISAFFNPDLMNP